MKRTIHFMVKNELDLVLYPAGLRGLTHRIIQQNTQSPIVGKRVM